MSLKTSFESSFEVFTFNIPMVLQKPRQVVIYDFGDELRMFSFYGTKSVKEVKVGEADCFGWTSEEGWKERFLQGDMRSLHFCLPDSNPDELGRAIDQMRRSEKILQALFMSTIVLALYVARRVFMEIAQNIFREAVPLAGLCFATYVAWGQYKQCVMEFAFGSALFCNNAFRIVETNMLLHRSNLRLSAEQVIQKQQSWW